MDDGCRTVPHSRRVVTATYNTELDGSFLGLGFSHGGVSSTSASSAVDTADSLMKQYLQQCLDYHEEQQQQQQQKDEAAVPQFVTAQYPPSPPPVSVTASVLSQPPVSPLSHPSALEAIAKARSIVKKFTQQHYSGSDILPADHRYRRELMLEKERKRLHMAMLKNFEYVACKEEDRLKVKLAQLQETKLLEQRLQQQHAALLRERKQASLAISKAGIGTSRRQTLEKSKQRQGHAVSSANDSSIAIYLSGLPNTMTEDSVRQLFASYGSIRRVHFYRQKQTGELKGDALVVYNAAADRQMILAAACSQMNGAELPCGRILRVEPADPQYTKSQTEEDREEGMGYYGPLSCVEPTENKSQSITSAQEGSGDNPGDDLDDFFDSLA